MKRVVIIGAGLAGSLLSNELVKSFDVTLLERGPGNEIEMPRVTFVDKVLADVSTFCYGGGGTTNLWHNGLIPISAEDIIDPVFRYVIEDSRRFIDQAAAALFFKRKSFESEYENLVEKIYGLSRRLSVFPNGIDCLIYPKKFRKLTADPRVRQMYDVEDIDFIFQGQRIRDVICQANGEKRTISADAVVVCAGTMGTPKVFRKITAAAGLPDESLAFRFIDHPMGFVGKIKFNKGLSDVIRKFSVYDRGDYISRNAVRLKSACGRYTACVFFRPAFTMSNNLDIYKYKSLLGAGRGMDRLKNAFSPKVFHPDILAEIVSHVFNFQIPGRICNLLFVGEQKPGAGRVFWNGNELHVDWSISPDELEVYRNMLRGLQGMLENLADEMNFKTDIGDDWLWSMAHHSGSVAMGDSDPALVDRNLKVRFCDNAYVCDGSVIQEHSYANTGLAIGQLAFRLAERIRDVYQ